MPVLPLFRRIPFTSGIFVRGGQPYFPIIASDCWLPCNIATTIQQFARFVTLFKTWKQASELPAAFVAKEAELVCSEMLISEAKWRVRAFQSLPWSPNAQKKRKSSLFETTPTEKRAHTFTAFAEAPSMHRSREAHRRWASMLVLI